MYIHYGSDEFIPWTSIRNLRGFQKPEGGLWASREGDPNGWEAWCQKEGFLLERLQKCFRFTLAEGSRVLTLENEDQLIDLPKQEPWKPKDLSWMEKLEPDQIPTREQLDELYRPNWCVLDFEELRKKYDAIEMINAGAFLHSLNLWDCNSILVMNADVVQVMEP